MTESKSVEVTSSFNIFHSVLKDRSPVVWFFLSAVVCLALFFISLSISSANRGQLRTVVNVYCASAAVEPFSKIAAQFNSTDLARSEGVAVQITRSGGSGSLAGQLNAEASTGVLNMADIFVSADSNRMSNLVDQEVITETLPVATQFPVIAICDLEVADLRQAGDLPSLLNLEIKLGVGSATSAIGFETRKIAKSNHCLDLLKIRKTADFENVISLAQALSMGSVDAAIVWDSTVKQFNQTDNRSIKILAYLHSGSEGPKSNFLDPERNHSSSKQNYSPALGFGKFSIDKVANPKRSGCNIEVGRSKSDCHQADLFFSYLKTNRSEVTSSFVDAGFSNLPMEPSLDNGREPNQP